MPTWQCSAHLAVLAAVRAASEREQRDSAPSRSERAAASSEIAEERRTSASASEALGVTDEL